MLQKPTISSSKAEQPKPTRIQSIRYNITQAGRSSNKKIASPAVSKISQQKSLVKKVPGLQISKSRERSSSSNKQNKVINSVNRLAVPKVSRQSTLSSSQKSEVRTQQKPKTIREVRLMNTRTSSISKGVSTSTISKGVSSSKKSLIKNTLSKESRKEKEKVTTNKKVSGINKTQLVNKTEPAQVSIFNEHINNSTISFRQKEEEDDKEDRYEVESILKYIPPLASPKLPSARHFVPLIPNFSQGPYFSDSLVVHRQTGMLFTLRTISKEQVTLQEREKELAESIKIHLFLSRMTIPHLSTLYAVFDDIWSIYLVLEPNHTSFGASLWKDAQYKQGLEDCLLSNFSKDIALTLHSLHAQSVMIRSISLDGLYSPFGMLKIDRLERAAWLGRKQKRHSFCGQIEEIAHQLAEGHPYDLSYDLWQVGITLYSLSTGQRPFRGEEALENIRRLNFDIPLSGSKQMGHLLNCLLTEPRKRLTLQELLVHPFLKGIKLLINRQLWSFWGEIQSAK